MVMASIYRETAESCFRMARSASREDDKSLWMKLAQYWLLKAHDAEREHPTFDNRKELELKAPTS
jgi:hypothetical protein